MSNLYMNTAKFMMVMAASVIVLIVTAPEAAAQSGNYGTHNDDAYGGGIMPDNNRSHIDADEAYQAGIAALQEGDYKEAEKQFGRVLMVTKSHPETNYFMGLTKMQLGKTKSAVRYFKRAVKEREDFVEAREQLAMAYLDIAKPDDASEQLEEMKVLYSSCEADGCEDAYKQRLAEAIARVSAAMEG